MKEILILVLLLFVLYFMLTIIDHFLRDTKVGDFLGDIAAAILNIPELLKRK